MTKAELQRLVEMYREDIENLNTRLKEYTNGTGLVERQQLEQVLNRLDNKTEQNRILGEQLEKEKQKTAELRSELEKVRDENDSLKETIKINSDKAKDEKVKNERGAGRKGFGDDIIKEVIKLKEGGLKDYQISHKLSIGTATVNRIWRKYKDNQN